MGVTVTKDDGNYTIDDEEDMQKIAVGPLDDD